MINVQCSELLVEISFKNPYKKPMDFSVACNIFYRLDFDSHLVKFVGLRNLIVTDCNLFCDSIQPVRKWALNRLHTQVIFNMPTFLKVYIGYCLYSFIQSVQKDLGRRNFINVKDGSTKFGTKFSDLQYYLSTHPVVS